MSSNSHSVVSMVHGAHTMVKQVSCTKKVTYKQLICLCAWLQHTYQLIGAQTWCIHAARQ